MVSSALRTLTSARRPRRRGADPRRRLEDRAGDVRSRDDRHRHRHLAAAGVHRPRSRDRSQRRRRGRPQLAEDTDGVRRGARRARRRLPGRGRAGVGRRSTATPTGRCATPAPRWPPSPTGCGGPRCRPSNAATTVSGTAVIASVSPPNGHSNGPPIASSRRRRSARPGRRRASSRKLRHLDAVAARVRLLDPVHTMARGGASPAPPTAPSCAPPTTSPPARRSSPHSPRAAARSRVEETST